MKLIFKKISARLDLLFWGKPKCERCKRLIEKNNYYRKQYVDLKYKLEKSK